MQTTRPRRSASKLIALLSAVWALSAGATGCSRQGAAQGDTRVTILFNHAKVSNPDRLKGLIEQFEAEQPHIRVQEQILPSTSDEQHQFYVINLAGGADDFDVLEMDSIWVPEFFRAGWLAELTESFASVELAPLLPRALEAGRFDGKLYGVPWFVDTGMLYYREDLLRKYGFQAPRTYAELSEMARAILAGENDPRLAGYIWQGMQYEGLVCVALEFIRGNGGAIVGRNGVPVSDGLGALTSGATLQALQFMSDLIRVDGASPPLVATLDEEGARHMFQGGRAIFMRNWPYAWPLMQAAGSPVAGRVGLAPVPHFDGHPSAPTLGGYHFGLNARSRHKHEAIAFMRFMIRTSVQRDILLGQGLLPANMEALSGSELPGDVAYLSHVRPALAQALPRPVTPYYLMISQILQPELSAVVTGIRTPQQAMRVAQTQIEHLLDGQ